MADSIDIVIDALQVRPRCQDALSVFRPGEDHLSPEVLYQRMSALDSGVPYDLWGLETFIEALDPEGRGVRPGPGGYCRAAFVDALTQVAARWGWQ